VTACYKVDSQDLNRSKGTRFLISVVDCAMDGKGGLSADGGGTQGAAPWPELAEAWEKGAPMVMGSLLGMAMGQVQVG
jgi:hypothetical protein